MPAGQGAAVVVVVAVVEVDAVLGDVVVVVELDGPTAAVPGVAVAEGEKVATNGVRKEVGRTTGTPSTWRFNEGVPNWTVVDPLA